MKVAKLFLVISVVLLLAVSAYAGSWKIRGKAVVFASQAGSPLVARCGTGGKQPTCDALRALHKKAPSRAKEQRRDTNPSAEFCRGQGGEVVIGVDAAQNENSFCEFRDGSLISTVTIYEAVMEFRKTRGNW